MNRIIWTKTKEIKTYKQLEFNPLYGYEIYNLDYIYSNKINVLDLGINIFSSGSLLCFFISRIPDVITIKQSTQIIPANTKINLNLEIYSIQEFQEDNVMAYLHLIPLESLNVMEINNKNFYKYAGK